MLATTYSASAVFCDITLGPSYHLTLLPINPIKNLSLVLKSNQTDSKANDVHFSLA
ncbi:hypothetical protein IAD21_02540 [Abditibacteriota bacterium]|nr:hypothetical protein IAD21_02540 [Abditibacteriota bacterium]